MVKFCPRNNSPSVFVFFTSAKFEVRDEKGKKLQEGEGRKGKNRCTMLSQKMAKPFDSKLKQLLAQGKAKQRPPIPSKVMKFES